MIPTTTKRLHGRNGGSDGSNAYLTKCRIAALGHEHDDPTNHSDRSRSVAVRGSSEWYPAEDAARTSPRTKALFGLAFGICLLLVIYVGTIWPHRGTIFAAKNLQSFAAASQQVEATPAAPVYTGEPLAKIEIVDLYEGLENLHETVEPAHDVAAREGSVSKARSARPAREAPSIPLIDAHPHVPEVPVRVDRETPLVPPIQVPLQEARATAVDTSIELLIAKPAQLPESAAYLLQKGRRLLEIGNIKAARDLFEDMAAAGIAAGAFALGSTFDPKSLAASGIANITPDPDKAVLWYRRAHLLAEAAAKRKRQGARD